MTAVAPSRRAAGSAGHVPEVGVLYPSGWGNLGDEAILQATFAMLRERWPEVRIRAFTLAPERTAALHGVEAAHLSGISLPFFRQSLGESTVPERGIAALRRRLPRGVADSAPLRVAQVATGALVHEPREARRADRWLRDADLLLVSGGGQLDDRWGGAWGQPWALARWSWQARRRGVPVAFLSVGFGSARTPLARRFLRDAVERAAYCSLRDAGSLERARAIGVRGDLTLAPDLAFRLKGPPFEPAEGPGRRIGLSPMVYLRNGAWPVQDGRRYDAFVQAWRRMATARAAMGDRLTFFTTDPDDEVAVEDVWRGLDDATRAACDRPATRTVEAVLRVLSRQDVVVVSRMHGAVLGLVAGRPVLGLSHERKVVQLLKDAGLGAYAIDLEHGVADAEPALRALDGLVAGAEALAAGVARLVSEWRQAVRAQEAVLDRLVVAGA